MISGTRRLGVPALLLVALAAFLVFAATASAETRVGETTNAISVGSTTPETTLVKGAASYESTSGAIEANVTTAAPPVGEGGIVAGLIMSPSCGLSSGPEAILKSLLTVPPPLVMMTDLYSSPVAGALTGSLEAPVALPATKTVSGSTTTLSLTAGTMANQEFNCAIVMASPSIGGEEEGEGVEEVEGIEEFGSLAGISLMSFPIVLAPPPPAPAAQPSPPASAVPASAKTAKKPPVLSFAQLKPVSLKTGKWATLRIKVRNTGATGTGVGTFRVKAPRGVLVKPERQQLPVIAPGGSSSMSVRVQLTEKAKPKSTLALTASASGVTGSGSLAMKAQG